MMTSGKELSLLQEKNQINVSMSDFHIDTFM